MIIAIPVNDKDLKSNIYKSFGRSPFFLIYNTETNESEFIKNDAIKSTGGAGIKAAQTIIDNKANVLLTFRCGQNAANLLKSTGIKLFKSTTNSIESNIKDLSDGKLSLLDDIHEGFHGHGKN